MIRGDKNQLVVLLILLLIAIFMLGLGSLLVLRFFFSASLVEMEDARRQQQARSEICQSIQGDLKGMENSFHSMLSQFIPDQLRAKHADFKRQGLKVQEALMVLKRGGEFSVVTRLNLEAIDTYFRTVRVPVPKNKKTPFCVIELAPKLIDAERKAEALVQLVIQRNKRDKESLEQADLGRKIRAFMKMAPPLFLRMHENANAIYYDARRELDGLEQNLKEETDRFLRLETRIITGVLVLVLALSVFIVFRVRTILFEQRTMQLLIAAEQEKLKLILETVQAGIVLIDPETHCFVEVNAEAARLIGEAPENIVGKTCFSFLCHHDGICPITDHGESVDNSERSLLCADQSIRTILKSALPINVQGRELILETFVDISDRKVPGTCKGKTKETKF